MLESCAGSFARSGFFQLLAKHTELFLKANDVFAFIVFGCLQCLE